MGLEDRLPRQRQPTRTRCAHAATPSLWGVRQDTSWVQSIVVSISASAPCHALLRSPCAALARVLAVHLHCSPCLLHSCTARRACCTLALLVWPALSELLVPCLAHPFRSLRVTRSCECGHSHSREAPDTTLPCAGWPQCASAVTISKVSLSDYSPTEASPRKKVDHAAAARGAAREASLRASWLASIH